MARSVMGMVSNIRDGNLRNFILTEQKQNLLEPMFRLLVARDCLEKRTIWKKTVKAFITFYMIKDPHNFQLAIVPWDLLMINQTQWLRSWIMMLKSSENNFGTEDFNQKYSKIKTLVFWKYG